MSKHRDFSPTRIAKRRLKKKLNRLRSIVKRLERQGRPLHGDLRTTIHRVKTRFEQLAIQS